MSIECNRYKYLLWIKIMNGFKWKIIFHYFISQIQHCLFTFYSIRLPCKLFLLFAFIWSCLRFSSLNAKVLALRSIRLSNRYSFSRRFRSFFSSGVSSLGLIERTLSVEITLSAHRDFGPVALLDDGSLQVIFCYFFLKKRFQFITYLWTFVSNFANDFAVNFDVFSEKTFLGTPVLESISIFPLFFDGSTINFGWLYRLE